MRIAIPTRSRSLTLILAGAGTLAFWALDLPLPFLFGPMAACLIAALSNLPIALWELVQGDAMPTEAHSWAAIAGIVLISSLLAFSTFQFGVRALGASIAGVFMYLLPPYGVGLAIVFLGEEFHAYHAAGIALVMAGVITATFPAKLLGRPKAKPA